MARALLFAGMFSILEMMESHGGMVFSRRFVHQQSEQAMMSGNYLFSLILETPAEHVYKTNQRIPESQRKHQTRARALDLLKFKKGSSDPRQMLAPSSPWHTLSSWLVW